MTLTDTNAGAKMADNSDQVGADGDGAAKAGSAKRRRLTFEMPLNLEEKVDRLVEIRGESRPDIIRRALEQFVKCEEFRMDDYNISAFKEQPDGTTKTFVFI